MKNTLPAKGEAANPTAAELIKAGAAGLMLVNPDNGVVFRAKYVSWLGVLLAVRIYPRGHRHPAKSPIMSHDEIDAWLAGLKRHDA